MKDYSAMSDQQINTAVGMSFGEKIGEAVNGLQIVNIDAQYLCSSFDPCNNPADAWPIIFANRIALMPDSSAVEWLAFSDFTLYDGDWLFSSDPNQHVNDKNPLRAAMIVFLMMKDAEKCDG